MCSDRNRLESLLTRLRDLDRRIAPPHERPIVEVARAALREEISVLSHRLHRSDYWRISDRAMRAS